ncbi:hypothetical protein ACQ5SP_08775 [Rhodovulum sp. YNF3179]|uniref:hypothetical protein n=1 Tax=Rhodovulum sp. YNF3179 TaxID=3425127 RepID=UPI003D34A20F
MTRFALLSLLLVLAACATPLERCVTQATRELRTVEGLIAETEANIARGYAIEEERVPYSYFTWCARGDVDEDGSGLVWCRQTDFRLREKPVAIDMQAERRKLADLEEKRRDLAAAAAAEIRRCRAAYPAN